MKLFITGISSFLGRHLIKRIPAHFEVLGCYYENPVRSEKINTCGLDLRDKDSLMQILNTFQPDVIVHMAGMTVVSQCEKDPEAANCINVAGTRNLAEYCAQKKIRLIYVSTDMVFDGRNDGFYMETDQPCPETVYGRTKLEAENTVINTCSNSIILRSALMYGLPVGEKKGFLSWMLQEAESNSKVKLFSDQTRTPVFVDDVCMLVIKASESDCVGIFHLGGPDRLNRVEMGEQYLPLEGISLDCIDAVELAQVRLPYAVQRNLSLNSNKAIKEFEFEFTAFSEGIRQSTMRRMDNG